jgi:NAD+ diphosphatase
MIEPLTFAGAYIERCSHLRADSAALVEHPDAGFLPIVDGRCLVDERGPLLLDRTRAAGALEAGAEPVFLGRLAGRWLFALPLGAQFADGFAGGRLATLGEITGRLPDEVAGVLAYARAIALWQQRHRHCGVCGARNRATGGGFVMACTGPECGHRSFPRLDPAIIVLVHDGERCLLGRQPSWPTGRMSTLAGFVEPGESLEDAVRREVREETDVEVDRCEYLGSQPWPFPAALMIGFHARAASRAIRLNDGELAEARWLTRAELAAGACSLPPLASIAFRLIEAWFDADGSQPPLASLGLASPYLRSGEAPPAPAAG